MHSRAPTRLGQVLLACSGLVALVALSYGQAGELGFVLFDDPGYVSENALVQRGVTVDGLRMAFTRFEMSNWHPLTWMSLMLDVQWFGSEPGWMHRINVLLHCLNTLLLFTWLRITTGAIWRSALAAALFAAHPQHVESVAWISERKDVLSTFFWMSTLLAYQSWTKRRGVPRYALVAFLLGMGLMAKPMVVTLPFVLMLVDVWPLGRLAPGQVTWSRAWPLIREKLPLFALAALASVVTLAAQQGARTDVENLWLGARALNAGVSAATYLRRMVVPDDLAVFYPHGWLASTGLASATVAWSFVLLAVLSLLTVWQWPRRPFLAVGWLWFLGTLVPVSGIVQVGTQAMADRYAYIPMIGIYLMVSWALPSGGSWPRWARAGGVAILLAALVWLGGLARAQVSTWKDTLSLFAHAVSVDPDNWFAWKNLGAEQFRRGDSHSARNSFAAAIRLKPSDADLWMNLAHVQSRTGEHAAAASSLERVLRLSPEDEDAWFQLSVEYVWLNRPDLVYGLLDRLRDIDPGRAERLAARLQERKVD